MQENSCTPIRSKKWREEIYRFKFQIFIFFPNYIAKFLSTSGTRGSDQPFPCDLQLLPGKLDYNDAGTPQARIIYAHSWTFIKR